eukprot:TRINITY_DN7528_c0_g1_i1.p1 TRINITY_DN7528_c0_g1~~TRINITY_DN7528_c0_g1_i1.p1  ORF type:complete len:2568 (-),score=484.97 TRINITY_DN7528_c0_g1_i1:341-7447(-)
MAAKYAAAAADPVQRANYSVGSSQEGHGINTDLQSDAAGQEARATSDDNPGALSSAAVPLEASKNAMPADNGRPAVHLDALRSAPPSWQAPAALAPNEQRRVVGLATSHLDACSSATMLTARSSGSTEGQPRQRRHLMADLAGADDTGRHRSPPKKASSAQREEEEDAAVATASAQLEPVASAVEVGQEYRRAGSQQDLRRQAAQAALQVHEQRGVSALHKPAGASALQQRDEHQAAGRIMVETNQSREHENHQLVSFAEPHANQAPVGIMPQGFPEATRLQGGETSLQSLKSMAQDPLQQTKTGGQQDLQEQRRRTKPLGTQPDGVVVAEKPVEEPPRGRSPIPRPLLKAPEYSTSQVSQSGATSSAEPYVAIQFMTQTAPVSKHQTLRKHLVAEPSASPRTSEARVDQGAAVAGDQNPRQHLVADLVADLTASQVSSEAAVEQSAAPAGDEKPRQHLVADISATRVSSKATVNEDAALAGDQKPRQHLVAVLSASRVSSKAAVDVAAGEQKPRQHLVADLTASQESVEAAVNESAAAEAEQKQRQHLVADLPVSQAPSQQTVAQSAAAAADQEPRQHLIADSPPPQVQTETAGIQEAAAAAAGDSDDKEKEPRQHLVAELSSASASPQGPSKSAANALREDKQESRQQLVLDIPAPSEGIPAEAPEVDYSRAAAENQKLRKRLVAEPSRTLLGPQAVTDAVAPDPQSEPAAAVSSLAASSPAAAAAPRTAAEAGTLRSVRRYLVAELEPPPRLPSKSGHGESEGSQAADEQLPPTTTRVAPAHSHSRRQDFLQAGLAPRHPAEGASPGNVLTNAVSTSPPAKEAAAGGWNQPGAVLSRQQPQPVSGELEGPNTGPTIVCQIGGPEALAEHLLAQGLSSTRRSPQRQPGAGGGSAAAMTSEVTATLVTDANQARQRLSNQLSYRQSQPSPFVSHESLKDFGHDFDLNQTVPVPNSRPSVSAVASSRQHLQAEPPGRQTSGGALTSSTAVPTMATAVEDLSSSPPPKHSRQDHSPAEAGRRPAVSISLSPDAAAELQHLEFSQQRLPQLLPADLGSPLAAAAKTSPALPLSISADPAAAASASDPAPVKSALFSGPDEEAADEAGREGGQRTDALGTGATSSQSLDSGSSPLWSRRFSGSAGLQSSSPPGLNSLDSVLDETSSAPRYQSPAGLTPKPRQIQKLSEGDEVRRDSERAALRRDLLSTLDQDCDASECAAEVAAEEGGAKDDALADADLDSTVKLGSLDPARVLEQIIRTASEGHLTNTSIGTKTRSDSVGRDAAVSASLCLSTDSVADTGAGEAAAAASPADLKETRLAATVAVQPDVASLEQTLPPQLEPQAQQQLERKEILQQKEQPPQFPEQEEQELHRQQQQQQQQQQQNAEALQPSTKLPEDATPRFSSGSEAFPLASGSQLGSQSSAAVSTISFSVAPGGVFAAEKADATKSSLPVGGPAARRFLRAELGDRRTTDSPQQEQQQQQQQEVPQQKQQEMHSSSDLLADRTPSLADSLGQSPVTQASASDLMAPESHAAAAAGDSKASVASALPSGFGSPARTLAASQSVPPHPQEAPLCDLHALLMRLKPADATSASSAGLGAQATVQQPRGQSAVATGESATSLPGVADAVKGLAMSTTVLPAAQQPPGHRLPSSAPHAGAGLTLSHGSLTLTARSLSQPGRPQAPLRGFPPAQRRQLSPEDSMAMSSASIAPARSTFSPSSDSLLAVTIPRLLASVQHLQSTRWPAASRLDALSTSLPDESAVAAASTSFQSHTSEALNNQREAETGSPSTKPIEEAEGAAKLSESPSAKAAGELGALLAQSSGSTWASASAPLAASNTSAQSLAGWMAAANLQAGGAEASEAAAAAATQRPTSPFDRRGSFAAEPTAATHLSHRPAPQSESPNTQQPLHQAGTGLRHAIQPEQVGARDGSCVQPQPPLFLQAAPAFNKTASWSPPTSASATWQPSTHALDRSIARQRSSGRAFRVAQGIVAGASDLTLLRSRSFSEPAAFSSPARRPAQQPAVLRTSATLRAPSPSQSPGVPVQPVARADLMHSQGLAAAAVRVRSPPSGAAVRFESVARPHTLQGPGAAVRTLSPSACRAAHLQPVLRTDLLPGPGLSVAPGAQVPQQLYPATYPVVQPALALYLPQLSNVPTPLCQLSPRLPCPSPCTMGSCSAPCLATTMCSSQPLLQLSPRQATMPTQAQHQMVMMPPASPADTQPPHALEKQAAYLRIPGLPNLPPELLPAYALLGQIGMEELHAEVSSPSLISESLAGSQIASSPTRQSQTTPSSVAMSNASQRLQQEAESEAAAAVAATAGGEATACSSGGSSGSVDQSASSPLSSIMRCLRGGKERNAVPTGAVLPTTGPDEGS